MSILKFDGSNSVVTDEVIDLREQLGRTVVDSGLFKGNLPIGKYSSGLFLRWRQPWIFRTVHLRLEGDVWGDELSFPPVTCLLCLLVRWSLLSQPIISFTWRKDMCGHHFCRYPLNLPVVPLLTSSSPFQVLVTNETVGPRFCNDLLDSVLEFYVNSLHSIQSITVCSPPTEPSKL